MSDQCSFSTTGTIIILFYAYLTAFKNIHDEMAIKYIQYNYILSQSEK